MRRLFKIISLVFFALTLTSCFDEQDTGAKDVRWDRDTCERCRMVLSDPHFAAQIRYSPVKGKRSKVAEFDDIGCAIIWLEDKPFENAIDTEIWVSSHQNREWINAKTATYVRKKTSPMEYGLGAQSEPVEGGMTYEQAKEHVYKIEEKYNISGADLHGHGDRE